MDIERVLNLDTLLEERSLFLFGPRQTGKSTFLKTTYPDARYFDLLKSEVFRTLSARPETLRSAILESDSLVIIDEIQKLPGLLDEVQNLIQTRKSLRFILTGSSARKLKRGAGNLLGGRALVANMHPLISRELGDFDLDRRLLIGSLPSIWQSNIPFEDLNAYVGTYLKEEILAEGLIRGIEGFSRFLEVAAITHAKIVNFTEVGSDAQVPPRTVQNYYQILEDTLIGRMVKPFRKTSKRKAIATAKFYFCDIGIVNALLGQEALNPRTQSYSDAFEQLVFLELSAYLDYKRIRKALTFWRTTTKLEVDFIVGEELAVEVKASEQVRERDLNGLLAIKEEFPKIRTIVVAKEFTRRKLNNGIEIIPVHEFCKDLWNAKVIS